MSRLEPLLQSSPSSSLAGAIALGIGIGIQNFPEGVAVSMPLRRDGMSRMKSFMYGQFSGMVEPISAVIGGISCYLNRTTFTICLSFAAGGAMIFVVAEEVIPGSQEEGNKDLASMTLMIGFTVMMILDVALG